jgi:uncharacterized repeat protein (TIGR01451 family)
LSLESLEERVVPSSSPLAAVTATPQHVLAEGGIAKPGGATSPAWLTPGQVTNAYGINNIFFNNGTVKGDGTGQTIAIVDAYHNPTALSDLQAFDAFFKIPDPPSFQQVNQNGGTNYPAQNSGWITEESLDVQWAHAVAPGANIILVESTDNSLANMYAAVDYARGASLNGAGVVAVSMSWSAGEYSGETSDDSAHFVTPGGHNGVTFLAATGDNGSFFGLGYPAASHNVVAVGGTTLTTDSNGDYLGESGWSGSGGGVSSFEARPAFQNGVSGVVGSARGNPDVSIIGGTPVDVYDSTNNGTAAPWEGVYGTSLATPVWAGLVAIADQGRGNSNSLTSNQTLTKLYSLPASDYHDITSGNNGLYSAGKGYDLVTGIGTPIASLLVPDLAGTTSTTSADLSVTMTGPGTVTAGNTYTYTITLTNGGPNAASSVTLSDAMPSGLTLVSESQTGGPDSFTNASTSSTAKFTLASMASGNTDTFQVVATVAASQGNGTTITNTSSVTSSTSDPNTSNNSSSVSSTVVNNSGGNSADLAISMQGPSTVTRGHTYTYTITAKNKGPNAASSASFTDLLPAGMTLVSTQEKNGNDTWTNTTANGTPSFTLANFPANHTDTFWVIVSIPTSDGSGVKLTQTATITSSTSDPVSSNNTFNKVSTTV